MKNKKIIKLYYTILILLLGLKVVGTLFSNGLSVHHGKKIAQLQIQRSNLLRQEMRLSTELSKKASLSQITSEFDISGFIAISNTISLNTSTTVASK